jgi:hypothetical protein
MADFEILLEEIKKHLDSNRQYWVFGAGISYESKIPLMMILTNRVEKIIKDEKHKKNIEIYQVLTKDLKKESHIEHYLSHIGDLIALAERSSNNSARICDKDYSNIELRNLYRSIIAAIGKTVRYGYSKLAAIEEIGNPETPIVEIANHIKFVQSLFHRRANLISRSKITFFTLNYDTLLEDALSIEKYIVKDGFSGGAVAFWNPENEFENDGSILNEVKLYKLHGSIDWYRDKEYGLVRTRYGTKYLSNLSDIMIYPQATKYVETQKDPFATLFAGFRKSLSTSEDNVVIICGYSFGDAHINNEIESALRTKGNRTTLIIFLEEVPDKKKNIIVNEILDRWLNDSLFGKQVYVAGKSGIYYNSTIPVTSSANPLNWWTFSGLIDFLETGEIS